MKGNILKCHRHVTCINLLFCFILSANETYFNQQHQNTPELQEIITGKKIIRGKSVNKTAALMLRSKLLALHMSRRWTWLRNTTGANNQKNIYVDMWSASDCWCQVLYAKGLLISHISNNSRLQTLQVNTILNTVLPLL